MRRWLGKSTVILAPLSVGFALLAVDLALADSVVGNNVPNVSYDAATGQVSVLTDGADIISLLIEGPQATSIERWQDGTNGDGITGWAQMYFNGKEQWVGAGSAISGGSVTTGSYDIATYPTGLTSADFGEVEVGTQSFGTLFTSVSFGATGDIVCDLDGDGDCDVADISMLTDQAGVTRDEILEWLQDAGEENGKSGPYLMGDANLDGIVNANDLNSVGQNWQATNKNWGTGDFNGDDLVNAGDLNEVGQNWQQVTPAAAQTAAVPEPSAIALLGVALLGLLTLRRR